MKRSVSVIFLIVAIKIFAQSQQDSTFHSTLKNLQAQVNEQQSDILKLYSELNKEYRTYRIVKKDLNQTIINKQKEVIDSLNLLIANSDKKLASINSELNTKINKTGQKADFQIAKLDSSVEKPVSYTHLRAHE